MQPGVPPPSASMGVAGWGEGSGSAKIEEMEKRDAKESIGVLESWVLWL